MKRKAPVGTTVSYGMSVAATVSFTVERKIKGRKVGKKCRKRTRANRRRKPCTLIKAVKGGFSHPGAAGQNRFKFTGRIGNRALRPGRYRLVGSVANSIKRAKFKIVP